MSSASSSCQRARKSGSPSTVGGGRSGSSATGPIKATRSFGIGSPAGALQAHQGNSSMIEGGWKKWRPSSTIAWAEKCTYGSTKEKKSADAISRSASYDTILTSYLSGEWPRPGYQVSNLVHCPIILTADKWTQTFDDCDDVDLDGKRTRSASKHKMADNFNEVKEIRAKRTDNSSCLPPAHHVVRGSSTLLSSKPSKAINIPVVSNQHSSLVPCQGSAEGFNQEIEKLVHTASLPDNEHALLKPQVMQSTPDGHRAPIAGLLSRRNIDLHMPFGGHCHSGVEKHFQRISADGSPSIPIIPDTEATMHCDWSESEGDGSRSKELAEENESPDPLICFVNSCSERLAPEGCEKVTTRVVEGLKQNVFNKLTEPIKLNCITNFHIPSERSAFGPLLKKYVNQQSCLF